MKGRKARKSFDFVENGSGSQVGCTRSYIFKSGGTNFWEFFHYPETTTENKNIKKKWDLKFNLFFCLIKEKSFLSRCPLLKVFRFSS